MPMPPGRVGEPRVVGPRARERDARRSATMSAIRKIGRLEEGERRALEVDAQVGAGERARGERGQERADARGGADAGRLEDVEEIAHC